VKWIVKPLLCKQFEKPAQPYRATEDNWPLDEQPAERKPVELTVAFSIQGERKQKAMDRPRTGPAEPRRLSGRVSGVSQRFSLAFQLE
jgi:hypothetical protein